MREGDPKKEETKEVTLANTQILNALKDIKQFDRFKFPALTTLKLVKVGITLKNSGEVTIKARDQIAKRYFPDGSIDKEADSFKEYAKEVQMILDEEVTFSVPVIAVKELNLEENSIPVSLLMDFSWLIDME